jgi:hypothetical protein
MGMVVERWSATQSVLGVFLMINYGTFEAMPAMFDDKGEAWVCYAGEWRKMPWAEVYANGKLLGFNPEDWTKEKFLETFPNLPPLPKGAFS